MIRVGDTNFGMAGGFSYDAGRDGSAGMTLARTGSTGTWAMLFYAFKCPTSGSPAIGQCRVGTGLDD